MAKCPSINDAGLVLAPLTLCRRTHTVTVAARSVELSHLSFRLLALLAERAPEPVPFDDIEACVWGHAVTRDTLKQRVRLVRAGLGQLGLPPAAIASAHGFGYRLTTAAAFAPDPSPSSNLSGPPGTDSTMTAGIPVPTARPTRSRSAVPSVYAAAVILLATAGSAAITLGRLPSSPTSPASPRRIRVAVRADGLPCPQRAERRVRAHLQAAGSVEVVDVAPRDLVVHVSAMPGANDAAMRFALLDANGRTVLWSERYDRACTDDDRAVLHFLRSTHAILERRLWTDRLATLTTSGWPNPLLDVLPLLSAPSPANLARADAVLRRLAPTADDAELSPSRSADRALVSLLTAQLHAELAIRHGRPFAPRPAVNTARAVARRYPDDPYVAYRLARVELAAGDRNVARKRLRNLARRLPWVRRDIGTLAGSRGPVP